MRELQQFLEQLDAEAAGGGVDASPRTHTIPPRRQLSAPDSRVPAPTIAAFLPDSSVLPDSRIPNSAIAALFPPNSAIAARLPNSAIAARLPPDSCVVDAQHLSSLTIFQVAILVDSARHDFKAKGYGQAAFKHNMNGEFILNANEVELSTLFSQMSVHAVDMPVLRKAVSSWKADPAQAFSVVGFHQEAAAARASGKPEPDIFDAVLAAKSGNVHYNIARVKTFVTADPACVNKRSSRRVHLHFIWQIAKLDLFCAAK